MGGGGGRRLFPGMTAEQSENDLGTVELEGYAVVARTAGISRPGVKDCCTVQDLERHPRRTGWKRGYVLYSWGRDLISPFPVIDSLSLAE
ncbi:hypothetical protein GWI33_017781 [Rhynchophorus ferrugineus]|uniref:Uncharacterized protein n=1 Tax=Rhynchophorus ferrugineus TaxID=354439 RepID=A0A834M7A5_RHYFE|nr:hypothetical protein GWI33_017781 [Rhynchophorus ferrugineus]